MELRSRTEKQTEPTETSTKDDRSKKHQDTNESGSKSKTNYVVFVALLVNF